MKSSFKVSITPAIASNEAELKNALDNEATAIYIENPLYSSIVDKVKKSNKGKLINSSGGIAALLGFFVISGPMAWVMFLGGTIAATLGSSMDSLKNYSVDIDEVSCRITLLRQKGKNKYRASKQVISR